MKLFRQLTVPRFLRWPGSLSRMCTHQKRTLLRAIDPGWYELTDFCRKIYAARFKAAFYMLFTVFAAEITEG